MSSPDPQSPVPAPGRALRQLAIFGELLPEIIHLARREPAFPSLLQKRLGHDKRFGSRDRRIYRALAYASVRHLPWVEAASTDLRPRLALWLAGDEPVLAPLRTQLLAEWPPLPVSPAEQASTLYSRLGRPVTVDQLFPDWLAAEAPTLTGPARDILLTRALLWLRLQTADSSAVDTWLRAEGIPFRTHSLLPDARAILAEVDLARSPLYESGAFEIQDLGSQLILVLAAPRPGTRWLDACAGAGGKTLQLARLLGPAGHVDATDIRPAALAELCTRATRAGLRNIATLATSPSADRLYDGVLVDAPCSGSGTWRRSPHLRWQTTAADLRRHHERQLAILSANAAHVRPGGTLVYATCSLAHTENDDTVAAFLAAHSDFHIAPPTDSFGYPTSGFGTVILPHIHDTDGLYLSRLSRR